MRAASTEPSAAPPSAASSRPRAKSSSLGITLPDSGSNLLRSTPPCCPPSLVHRTHGTGELFQYYVLRGHMEVLGCLSTADATRAAASAVGHPTTAASIADETGNGLEMEVMDPNMPPAAELHSPNHALAAGIARPRRPETRPVPPPGPVDSAQPLFPRLRPSAAADRQGLQRKALQEVAVAAAQRERAAAAALPPAAGHYAGLYRARSGLSAEMEAGMSAEVIAAAAAASAAAAAAVASPLSGARGRGAAALGTTQVHHVSMGPSASSASVSGASMSRPPTNTLATATATATARGVPLVRNGSAAALTAPQRAALLRESRWCIAEEMGDVFATALAAAQPGGPASAVAEMQPRRSTRAATVSMGTAAPRKSSTRPRKSTGSKSAKASTVTAARPAALPPNLSHLTRSLLACCDEWGQVTGADVEAVLADVPFEAAAGDAARELVHVVRQVSEVRQREANEAAAAMAAGVAGGPGSGAGGTALDASYQPNASRRSLMQAGGPGPGHLSSYSSQPHGGSIAARRTPGGPGGSVATSAGGGGGGGGTQPGNSRTSLSYTGYAAGGPGLPTTTPTPGPARVGHHGTSGSGLTTGSGVGSPVGAQPLSAPAQHAQSQVRVLVREIVGAVDVMVNSPATRSVVRWACFNTFAAEGQGYIHRSTLASLRRRRRGECEGPHATFTASMVKALDDAFAIMAAEEEAAFIGKTQKKSKKRGAGVKLAPNQKSAIPLSVMRRSHMDFPLFCRYFDELPQLCAAFTPVWVSLVLGGRTPSSEEVPPASLAATVVMAGEAPSPRPNRASLPTAVGNGSTALLPLYASGAEGEVAGPGAVGEPAGPGTVAPTVAGSDGAPLTLLGPTPSARRTLVHNLIHAQLARLREAAETVRQMSTQQDTD